MTTERDDEDLQDPLSMSDEEIEQMVEPSVVEESNEEEDINVDDLDDADDEQEADAEDDAEPVERVTDSSSEGQSIDEEDEEEGETIEENQEKETASLESKQSKQKPLNAKKQLEQLFAPFKANGKEINVNNVEDAISLMQMGANYNKKMAGLKPNLKLMKMLQNNGLLDEGKLSKLIDLDKKNPAAIKNLIKESGIDIYDFAEEEENKDQTEYEPNTYTVDDKEFALDEALNAIQDSPTYNKTVDTISNKWDAASKSRVYEDPDIIGVINSHMSSGVYDQIMTIVENERTLGRLTDKSDLDAYQHVGDILSSQGAFEKGQSGVQKNNLTTAKRSSDPKLKNRKRAASTTRASSKTPVPTIDPLAMSDEEFEKLAMPQFM